jgi:hypothetical protein
MRRVQLLGILALGALGLTAASAPGANPRAEVTLGRPLPNPVRVGQRVTITGQVRHVRPSTSAVLESMRQPQGRWRAISRAGLRRGGSFTLRLRIPGPAGLMFWRVAAVRGRRTLTATRAQQLLVGPAPVYCKPPPPIMQNIPAGDGWIVGGAYIEGGPAPGIYSCASQPYTVTARKDSGAVAASQRVPGGHSYTLVVPAGHYSLKSSSCGFGSATVTAGKQTHADVVCPVP